MDDEITMQKRQYMFFGTVNATVVALTGTLFCVAIENDSALMMVKSGLAWGGLIV